MKNSKIKKIIGLIVAAFVLTVSINIDNALAYFTTFATATGGITMNLSATNTEINEEKQVVDGLKKVSVENKSTVDCYVRIKVFVGDKYKNNKTISYLEPDGLSNWTPGADGYYYYNDIVPAKGNTTQLHVKVTFPVKTEDEIPTDFNVIVIQESTPVLYDANGTPYADWDAKADVINPAPAPQPQPQE